MNCTTKWKIKRNNNHYQIGNVGYIVRLEHSPDCYQITIPASPKKPGRYLEIEYEGNDCDTFLRECIKMCWRNGSLINYME